MVFQTKKLVTPPRFCLRLKEARLRRGISLEKMAEVTHVNIAYLKALEECRLHELPHGAVYTRQYIRLYAEAVGLPEETLLKSFHVERGWERAKNKAPSQAEPSINKKSFLNIPKFVRGALVFGASGILVAFVAFQMMRFLEPPKLAVSNPPDGFVTSANVIVVDGQTEKEALVHINGTPVVKSEEGTFTESIPLERGLNTISIQATKKSGKQTTLTRTIVREMPEDKISLAH